MTIRALPLFAAALSIVAFAATSDLRTVFQNPPDDARIMMRWWWFGPAVSKPEIEREIRLMKQGGIGGFEIQPVYPLALDDPAKGIRNLPYLSDEFIDALRFAADKGRELGMRVDLTVGSGWPYGGATVPITQAAGKLRCERVKVRAGSRDVPVPAIGPGEKLLAAFEFPGSREITDLRGSVAHLASSATNEVQFYIASRTRMKVKRASAGAEGYVLDHYDGAAVQSYLHDVGDRLLRAFGPNPPTSVFCDSLEVFGSDWTTDFLEEFAKRRGYDLKPLLPALYFGTGGRAEDVRYDWGRTLTELVEQRFFVPMHAWAKANKTLFRIQGYGTPPATVSSYANSDLPEGEGPQWKVLRASRWASSASHLYGRTLTSSETWTWLHSPVFRATPLDMKAEADLHFLQGINQLIGHGWPYTPEGVEYPGWRLYAAAVFNEKNPWFPVMPDLAKYLQRISYLLRQGKPANDVALYLPNSDTYAHFTPGHAELIKRLPECLGPDIVARILEAGYNLDFVDDAALALVPGRYRIVILPGVERLPLPSLRKLEEFVRGGGILVATRRLPSLVPGWKASAAEQQELRDSIKRLFETPNAPAIFVKDENAQLTPALGARLQPDVAIAPASAEFGFVHRSTEDAEIYFVANTSNVRQKITATFRVADGMQPEIWDPFTGRTSPQSGRVLALDLEPYASRVIVFAKGPAGAAAQKVARRIPSAYLDLSAGWSVRFAGVGKSVTMERLRSWTEDEATRYYSGIAVYEKQVEVAEVLIQNAPGIRLDFGEGTPIATKLTRVGMRAALDAPIREAAIVYVNGKRAGSLWCPPYSLDVSGLLWSGRNEIRIEVGNLAVNHMAGRPLPDYKALDEKYDVRFDEQDMDQIRPEPSGLLGSIHLRFGPRD